MNSKIRSMAALALAASAIGIGGVVAAAPASAEIACPPRHAPAMSGGVENCVPTSPDPVGPPDTSIVNPGDIGNGGGNGVYLPAPQPPVVVPAPIPNAPQAPAHAPAQQQYVAPAQQNSQQQQNAPQAPAEVPVPAAPEESTDSNANPSPSAIPSGAGAQNEFSTKHDDKSAEADVEGVSVVTGKSWGVAWAGVGAVLVAAAAGAYYWIRRRKAAL